MYAVITENDSSKWDDKTGVHYHFPPQYVKFLSHGTKVIYYKGRLTDKKYSHKRLSLQPHYFGKGTIGKITKEVNSKNYYATILDYVAFEKALPFKLNGSYIENIPPSKSTNYWRGSVRSINQETYHQIIQLADAISDRFNDQHSIELSTTVFEEGGKKKVYTTTYERNKKLRDAAVLLHGYSCACCDFNFGETYGEFGEGFIHVHHLKPISNNDEKIEVNPSTDLEVVCPNCHAMLHHEKNKLLTVEDLKKILRRK